MEIEDYELPPSAHATQGMLIYFTVFGISAVVMETFGSQPLLLSVLILLLLANHLYWYCKDGQTYATYKSNYISMLDQLDVAQIERKIDSVDFGSPTERFLTSYLRKARGYVSPPCYQSELNYQCQPRQ